MLLHQALDFQGFLLSSNQAFVNYVNIDLVTKSDLKTRLYVFPMALGTAAASLGAEDNSGLFSHTHVQKSYNHGVRGAVPHGGWGGSFLLKAARTLGLGPLPKTTPTPASVLGSAHSHPPASLKSP